MTALPAAGFAIPGPELPADPAGERIERALRRGIRGTLLSTGQDRRPERQKQSIARLAAIGLDARIVVRPEIGHWYPPDLDQLIDEAVAHDWR